MSRIHVGQVIDKKNLVSADSRPVQIPDAKGPVHLQFRRFAGCPFCSVHLHSFVRRHDEIEAANIREVAVFRSGTAALQRHHDDAPFPLIADPENKLYAEFGVGSGVRALLSPRALLMALPNVIRMFPRFPAIPPWGRAMLGLPADFLIASDGRVLACKYGMHADDQWSVDELLSLTRECVS